MNISEMSPEAQRVIAQAGLDVQKFGSGKGVIEQGDRARIKAYLDSLEGDAADPGTTEIALGLLKVASGTHALLVPRSRAVEKRVATLVADIDGSKTIARIASGAENPLLKSMTAKETAILLQSLLSGVVTAGRFFDRDEQAIGRILQSVPPGRRGAVARALVVLLGDDAASVGKSMKSSVDSDKLAEVIVKRFIKTELQAEHQRLMEGKFRASQYAAVEFGYRGLSFQALDETKKDLGEVAIFIWTAAGKEKIGSLDPGNFSSTGEITSAMLALVRAHHYGGLYGQGPFPPNWLSKLEGVDFRRDKLIDEQGRVVLSRRVLQRNFGFSDAAGLAGRLKQLGFSGTPYFERTGDQIRLSADQAELLLLASHYRKRAAALGISGEVIKLVGDEIRFVMPSLSYKKFARLLIRDMVIDGKTLESPAQVVRAVKNRARSGFDLDSSRIQASSDNITLSMPPDFAKRFFDTSQFAFDVGDGKDLSPINLYWAGVLTDEVYFNFKKYGSMVTSRMQARGFSRVEFIEVKGCEVMVAHHPKFGAIVVYRGSNKLKDFIIDSKLHKHNLNRGMSAGQSRNVRAALAKLGLDSRLGDESIKLHNGFLGHVSGIHGEIRAALLRVNSGKKPERVFVLGHSKGGAESIISAAALKLGGFNVHQVIALEPLRSGNKAFADAYDSVLKLGKRTHVTSNQGDPVTQLPPRSFGYRMAGKVYYFLQGRHQAGTTGRGRMLRSWIRRKPIDISNHVHDHKRGGLMQLLERNLYQPFTLPIEQPVTEGPVETNPLKWWAGF